MRGRGRGATSSEVTRPVVIRITPIGRGGLAIRVSPKRSERYGRGCPRRLSRFYGRNGQQHYSPLFARSQSSTMRAVCAYRTTIGSPSSLCCFGP